MSAADEIDRRILPCVDAARRAAEQVGATLSPAQAGVITLAVLDAADQVAAAMPSGLDGPVRLTRVIEHEFTSPTVMAADLTNWALPTAHARGRGLWQEFGPLKRARSWIESITVDGQPLDELATTPRCNDDVSGWTA